MCGIAGLVGVQTEEARHRVCEALHRLAHRGPDGEGIHESEGAVLGMRRLAIIDLACGDQPIYTEDRGIATVCNGELYNYVEQFPVLEGRGHRFQSRSDINLIPHYFEEKGAAAFQECRGMFAAAVWDERSRTLTLARDRVGKKPLYWTLLNGASGLGFASELPALLALREDVPALSTDALAAYLQLGSVPHPHTIYQGVHALPPGCTLQFRSGQAPRIEPYWTPVIGEPYRGTRAAAFEELDERLREAVKLRLRSDVPVGLFLSGGIDSGLVASYARDLGARDLLCFVVEVGDEALNEAPLARETARHLGLPVETITVPLDPLGIVERIATLYGQPFGDSSAVPSYLVAKAARPHRKVVLNGDGGDEVFAGYRRYWLGRAASRLVPPARPFGAVLSRAGALLANAGGRRSGAGFLARALRGIGVDEHTRYLRWTGDLFDDKWLGRVFPDLTPGRSPLAELERLRGGECVGARGLKEFQRSDYRLILADDLLSKMDIATMANSLEARSPFLDVPLAEFAWTLPDEWLITYRETKPLLRELARRRLPPAIATARKRGFEVPVRRWVQHELKPLINETLLASDSRTGGFADRPALRAFVNGASGFSGNLPQSTWTLLMLELFLRDSR
jgi:asparagine synthase (glutamine-hydrolysing)